MVVTNHILTLLKNIWSDRELFILWVLHMYKIVHYRISGEKKKEFWIWLSVKRKSTNGFRFKLLT